MPIASQPRGGDLMGKHDKDKPDPSGDGQRPKDKPLPPPHPPNKHEKKK